MNIEMNERRMNEPYIVSLLTVAYIYVQSLTFYGVYRKIGLTAVPTSEAGFFLLTDDPWKLFQKFLCIN